MRLALSCRAHSWETGWGVRGQINRQLGSMALKAGGQASVERSINIA